MIRLLFGLAMLLTLPGCGRSGQSKGRVLVLVAASTRDAVQEIAGAFTRETGVEVRLSADDSSRLAAQIVEGAPADLFLSANVKWANHVKDDGLADRDALLLGNKLVLIVPRGNPAGIHRPDDLTGPAVKHLALAGPTVPAGMYGRQALKKLHLWEKLDEQNKIVSGENVRATLAYVERGEAEAGIVYSTDARITDQVTNVYEFPASLHDPIRYPLVLLKSAAGNEPARRFFDFLCAPAAEKVFTRHGFTWLGSHGR
jgi:molybdate transport system substrate-binding protein